jgi:hypothetical protein
MPARATDRGPLAFRVECKQCDLRLDRTSKIIGTVPLLVGVITNRSREISKACAYGSLVFPVEVRVSGRVIPPNSLVDREDLGSHGRPPETDELDPGASIRIEPLKFEANPDGNAMYTFTHPGQFHVVFEYRCPPLGLVLRAPPITFTVR